MKLTLTLTAIAFLLSFSSFGQRDPQTLLGDGIEYTSGFGGFMLQFPSIDGNVSSMTGGGGAVIINNQFYLGGYGLGLADDKRVTVEGVEYFVDFGHGGIMMGYVIMPTQMVHMEVGTKVGWGQVSFRETPSIPATRDIHDNIFLVNPTVSVEVNMTSWFKLNTGVGFQFANGVDNFYYDSNDFNGVTYNLSLLFGWFR